MKQHRLIMFFALLLTTCISPAERRTAEFHSIRLSYDPTLFTAVEAQIAPESIMLGAFENGSTPQHTQFALTSYFPQHQERVQKPEIAVYSTADFKKVNAYFSKDALPELRNLLNEKPITLAAGLKLLYILPGCCFERMQVAYLKFQNGTGVRFVAYQRGQSVVPISNSSLYYIFLGLSDDGQHFVSAFLPVDVSFLPERSNIEVSAIPTRAPAGANSKERFNATIAFNEEATRRIAQLDSTDFTPQLKPLDEMIQSLQAK